MRHCRIIGLTLGFLGLALTAQGQAYHQYVDPMIGSEGLGRVFIGPSYPFGMVKPGPDCTSSPNSGWLAEPVPVTGFAQVHVSGTGGGPKYGNILLMPFSGALDKLDQAAHRESEDVALGYYRAVLVPSRIKVEITASHKVSFYRLTYPAKQAKALKIDAGFFLGEQPVPDAREAQQFVGSEIEVVSDTEIRGYSRIRGGWNNGGAYTVYFAAVFDAPVADFSTWKGTKLFPGQRAQVDSGEKTGALLHFKDGGPDSVKVKVGISFLSTAKARENIGAEIPGWDFGPVLGRLRSRWNALLGRVELDKTTPPDQQKLFYTSLYHTMLMPVNRTDENPLWTSAQPYYDDFYAIWDTFRSSNPLITLLAPKQEAEIVNSLINIYQHDGYLPDARSGNANGRTQGGSNAEVLIADAFVKKLPGIDYVQGLAAMLKDATVPPGGNEEQEGRGGLPEYNRLGYVPHGVPRAGNRTLDYAYDDFCIATVAKGQGQDAVYQRFRRQASNWQNLWRDGYRNHGATGFIMPRDAAGKWLDSIPYGTSNIQKPRFVYTPLMREYPWYVCHWCGFFYEATSWEYSLSVPHQVPVVIAKSGGNAAFQARLDTLFEKRYYNVANEPSFLTPSLYHWIGRPDLSSRRIRRIIADNFNTTHFGLPGNDDSGAMSSWLAFQLLGLYPNAGQSYYLLNAPLVRQSVLHQEGGKDFTITARNFSPTNVYITAARLNGKPFKQAWIEHRDIVRGGELVLEMGAQPSTWGTTILPPDGSKL
ncbi:GH92 family glycosyl hydrolase [Hymenobacter sp.]|uniref:GH92 family glycosyl hydrolase n=1 Tax=Hymenobacter sp. TaxID=1898978 RepID=UPI00286B7A3E|nr:GH92 family glycosyl hydrolase [Hymenobacter sp.]